MLFADHGTLSDISQEDTNEFEIGKICKADSARWSDICVIVTRKNTAPIPIDKNTWKLLRIAS